MPEYSSIIMPASHTAPSLLANGSRPVSPRRAARTSKNLWRAHCRATRGGGWVRTAARRAFPCRRRRAPAELPLGLRLYFSDAAGVVAVRLWRAVVGHGLHYRQAATVLER
jgi:hypothetical protein